MHPQSALSEHGTSLTLSSYPFDEGVCVRGHRVMDAEFVVWFVLPDLKMFNSRLGCYKKKRNL